MSEFVDLVDGLRAAGEQTRLRLIALLGQAELAVSELVFILKQSQPRVSRHLKLLTDAGLVTRNREGAWVLYRLADDHRLARLREALVGLLQVDDAVLERDRMRLGEVRAQRAEVARRYFAANAAQWEHLRALHIDEREVECALLAFVQGLRFSDHLDIGTGTGRIVELFAPQASRSVGIDLSPEMLAIARQQMAVAGLARVQMRLADLYDVPMADRSFDLITIHQVLHFLDDPARAVAEAARLLRPGGLLMMTDFAPHGLENLREDHQHRRLGFSTQEVEGWLKQCRLGLVGSQALGSGRSDGLTVCIWWAGSPATVRARRQLEAAL